MMVQRYDSGLLSDYGGGNVGWWQDYIRHELNRCTEYYEEEVYALEQKNAELVEKVKELEAELSQQSGEGIAIMRAEGARRIIAEEKARELEVSLKATLESHDHTVMELMEGYTGVIDGQEKEIEGLKKQLEPIEECWRASSKGIVGMMTYVNAIKKAMEGGKITHGSRRGIQTGS